MNRLRLCRLGQGDRALFRRIYTCVEVMADVGPPMSTDEADCAFDRACAYNRMPFPAHRFWTLSERGYDLGIVALLCHGACAEVGVMLLPQAWTGQYAKPALSRVIDHAFMALQYAGIVAESRAGVRERVTRRLLHPYPFQRVNAPQGRARWELSRDAWSTARQSRLTLRTA